jgi:hypothetical protein
MMASVPPIIGLILFGILSGLIGYGCILFVYWRTKE